MVTVICWCTVKSMGPKGLDVGDAEDEVLWRTLCRVSKWDFEIHPVERAGNPIATTFMDYLLPTAAEVPVIEFGHVETPSQGPGGYKGVGEGGAIGSPPAVVNAVADALSPFGVVITRLPLGPAQVLGLTEEARSQ